MSCQSLQSFTQPLQSFKFVCFLHRDIAIEILKSDHWKSALRNTSQSVHGNKVTTPLRKLIKKMPGKLIQGGWSIRISKNRACTKSKKEV